MWMRLRWIAIGILVLLIVVVVLQNTDTVDTKLLFVTVTMPRALLLVTTTLIGFALGVLVSFLLGRKKARSSGTP